ncbi:MAG: nucleoside phosphorylase [Desulforhabdus sp.]|jgi:uridine phosphorylase|nr:nucleoside phosphorylase [Desulforhabdus sp.]
MPYSLSTIAMLINADLPVIEPKRGKHEELLPSSGLLVFTPQDMELILKNLPTPPKRSHKLYLADVFTGMHEGRSIAVAGPSLGAPQTIMILEKLIALGIRDVLALGWCGSLQPHVAIGDVVLPTGAISEEGTSGHYLMDGGQPGPAMELMTSLKQAFVESSLPIHEGNVWTTDAPYRETVGKVLKYKAEGILAVEMEVSALFTVACFRQIRLAAALIVSDALHSLSWTHGFRNADFKLTRKKMAKAILKAVGSISQKDG